MTRSDWPRDARDPGPFEASLKCCTYEPFLPNFTIGRLLAEDLGSKGDHRERLARAIERGQLSPLGLRPRPVSAASDTSNSIFGTSKAPRCAFLNSGRCTIWAHRPSVCRSYFCVSDQGAAGQARWREAEALGNRAEWTLAHELLWDLGFTQPEIDSGTWAEWRDRKDELFLEVAKRAFGDFF